MAIQSGSRILLLICGLLALYVSGVGMRRSVYEAQVVAHQIEPPFTLESALYFRRVTQVFEEGSLPAQDFLVQIPEGVPVYETYSIGSEFIHAWLAKLFPSSMNLAQKLRWIEVSWASLGVVFLALWVGRWQRSWVAGMFGGAAYAFMLSTVIRSTGIELSRENFALPIFLASLAAAEFARGMPVGHTRWMWGGVASLLMGCSWMAWDMIQYLLGLWVVACWLQCLAGRLRWSDWDGRQVVLHVMVLLMGALLNPYLRSHGAWNSPLIVGALALILMMAAVNRGVGRGGVGPRVMVGVGILFAGAVWVHFVGGTGENYSHFTELLSAKLAHGNRKPDDPGLLTFAQRIMWVPGLNSANIRLTFWIFPAMFWLSSIGGVACFFSSRYRSDPRFVQLFFCSAFTFLAFVFFVRFHVFSGLFVAALTGVVGAAATRLSGWRSWAILSLCGFGLALEAIQVLAHRENLGRGNVYYHELMDLVDWMRDHADKQPLLANFGTSAAVLAYSGCPIVLHPKFERAGIRSRVENYGNALFKGTEKDFRDWADEFGVVYYVYGKGEFSRRNIPMQMRYFVDAVDPPEHVVARRFEAEDPTLLYFRPVWSNRKYTVYRMRTRRDEAAARSLGKGADIAFQEGDWGVAERFSREALALDATNERALRISELIKRLRAKGVVLDDD